ncbi:hypothetical protein OK351_17750 [Glutamicibacter sp. MNS18]|uniref:hypothetical protein n=1 Tax=Glutamicibacter sp. MNS18 TaxID=2989817 RepID=UPI002236247D|nr:hypothetical protein [Glutamicibacter sp. MNS18]MCW4467324.1 hypothetical protein [Glutamicibacter sp. MNS18]
MAKPAEAALSGIREAILDGAWMPGERLAPPHLAQRFSTSTVAGMAPLRGRKQLLQALREKNSGLFESFATRV